MSARAVVAVAAVLAVSAWAGTAAAHDFWIEPAPPSPAAGAPVAVALRVGERLVGEPVARNPERIVRFGLVDLGGGGGETPVAGLAGWEPAGRARPLAAGLHAVVYQSHPVAITLEAEKFEAYLAEEGLDAVLAARAATGGSGQPGRERYARSAKALLEVQPAEGISSATIERGQDRPLGLPLELVAEGDPFHTGTKLIVRLRFQGEPLAGARVVALVRGADGTVSEPQAARSGADGRVRFRLDRPGFWLVKAVHMVAAGGEPAADWESLWASLTFTVPAD